MAFAIRPDGHVEHVRVLEGLGSPVIEGCIVKVYSELEFPTADKPTKVEFPILFRRSREQEAAP